jgi:hypothetical protein
MNFPKVDAKTYTLPQAAQFLGINVYQLRKAMMKGDIRSKRCSDSPKSHFRFTKEWLLEYQRNTQPQSLWMKLVYWLTGYSSDQTHRTK